MPLSDYTRIEVKNPTNPACLVTEWVQEAKRCGQPPYFITLATASKDGHVTNRAMTIKEILPDASITFVTQLKSPKIQFIKENPCVAATLVLSYSANNVHMIRQICLVGKAVQLSKDQCKTYFEAHSLPAKIRFWTSQDCKPTEWNEFKAKHDALLKEVTKGKVLEMPDTLVAYKIVPQKLDFYSVEGSKIGDRIVFVQGENDEWKMNRVMP